MSRVRRRDTDLELILRRALWAAGFRYRLKNSLPGKPDIVFKRARLAVFVDGCFWHGCPKHSTIPKSNTAFWKAKLGRNRERDIEVGRTLKRMGWKVIRIWQHELKANSAKAVSRIERALIRRDNE